VSRRHRYAPRGWQPGATRVRYTADDAGLLGKEGVFVGNSLPLPGVTPRPRLGVLIRFDGEGGPLDVDPADLEVVPGYGCIICGPGQHCPDDAMTRQWDDHDPDSDHDSDDTPQTVAAVVEYDEKPF
jgi:hypothetical protein